jgi:hypothetical protein
VVEVVAEDEFVACDGGFWGEREGYGVAVVGVLGRGEVGGCLGAAFWQSYIKQRLATVVNIR